MAESNPEQLEVAPAPPIDVSEGGAFLSTKDEPSETIQVPAEDRVILVPRRL